MENNINIRGSGVSVLSELRIKLSGYDEAILEYCRKIMNSTKFKEWLVQKNKENLGEGFRPDGSEITKTPTGKQKSTGYEAYTKYLKEREGKIASHVTLYDTGAFYAGIKAVSGSDTIYIISTDSKEAELVAIWGEVLGISDDNRKEFIEMLYPELVKFTRNYFKNG